MRTLRFFALAAALTAAAGCRSAAPAPLYEKVPVERRTIIVSASAAGAIEPVRTVEVKSKASGEIIQLSIETGDDVEAGRLLARIDPRVPRNTLALAEANLEVAKARLANATAQRDRSEALFKTQAITEQENETARLEYVNANTEVVRAKTDLESARDQMADTEVRAPSAGTVLSKNVELGTVISSPTRDVGGGTVLFKMANLDTMQIRTLVDETDIGKVEPGLPATITVDAYPTRPFEGEVLKIEPEASVQQNVTMFPVLVRIANPGHLLKPGMNTEVEIHMGRREDVVAVPYSALRTLRDVASAAAVLGLQADEVQAQLASGGGGGEGKGDSSAAGASGANPGGGAHAATAGADSADGAKAGSAGAEAGGAVMSLPDGRTVTLPPGVTADDVRTIMQKRRAGKDLTPEEQSLMRRLFAGGGGGRRSGGGSMRGGASRDPGSYIVFVMRGGKPFPVEVKTGLTDLDYIEVVEGIAEGDTVVVLPSASLVNSQREFRERVQRMTGGGGIPGLQQQQPSGRTR